MAYECQNFKDGQILTAECLNKIDEWLSYICGREIVSGAVNESGELVFTLCNGETLNVGVVTGADGLTITDIVTTIDDTTGKQTHTIEFSDGSTVTVSDGEDGSAIEFASDEEVGEVLDTIYTNTGTDREDSSGDNTLTDEDFASDEEVGDMLDEVFGA